MFPIYVGITRGKNSGNIIDQVIKERNTGAFIQCFWRSTSVLVVGDELVKNNTDRGVIGIFIEGFYGIKFLERELAIGIGMSCSLTKSGDCKPCPDSICDEALPIWIPLEKTFEGIPALVNSVCRKVQI